MVKLPSSEYVLILVCWGFGDKVHRLGHFSHGNSFPHSPRAGSLRSGGLWVWSLLRPSSPVSLHAPPPVNVCAQISSLKKTPIVLDEAPP